MKKLFILLALPFLFLLQAASIFLESEDAFKPTLTIEGNTLHVEVVLGKDIYVYKDKVELSSENAKLNYKLPRAIIHDGFEGPEEIYENILRFDAQISDAKNDNVKVKFSFNGCSAQGLCYPPIVVNETFTITPSSNKADVDNDADLSDEDKIQEIFHGSFIVILITFFGLGVLLSLTPCVFPMIPILSSIIVSQGEKITTKRSFFLSMVYVLAMATAYTIAGILSAKSGDSIQAALQTPWILVAFAMTFVLLSLSMFGFYDIEMPKWVQTKMSKVSRNAEGNGVVGVATMGFLSALIVGPCVAAPLAGVLAYIGQTGDAVLGGSALFMMSMGMGLPLLLVGLGAGRFMPKPGGWMDAVKAIFGVMMLAVAIWMLKRVVDESVTMLLISFLAIVSSIYLGSLDSHYTDTGGWHRFSKGVGILLLLYGVFMFVGSFTKGTITDPLKSFSGTGTLVSKATKQEGIIFTKTVTSIKDLDKVLSEAGSKVVMLDFTASWCTQCEELEEDVFKNTAVIKATKDFVLVHADISVDTTDTKALKLKLEVQGPPALRFFRNSKEISRASRMQGPNLETFMSKINKL